MEKQHAFKKIEKDLKEGQLSNLLLFYGKEQYLVKWSVNAVVNKFVDETCRALDFGAIEPEKVTIDNIIGSCETLTMVSEKRVVLLPDFPLASGTGTKNFSEEAEKELIAYFQNIPETCILILTGENVDKRKKLYKEIVARGAVYEFGALDEQTLSGFIEKRFRSAGKTAKPSVVRELIKCSGYFHKETDYTLFNLENDLKKIIAHCESDEIALADVLEIISGDIEANVFALIDAVSLQKKGEAYRHLYNLLRTGENVFMILSLLASQFETMLEVKEMREEGKRLAQIQTTLNIHEYRIKKAEHFADRYSLPGLRSILGKVYQVEKNIKTGLMEPTLALEILISEI